MQAADKSSRILQKMDIIKPKITYMVSEYGLPSYYVWWIEQGVQQILEDDENLVVQNIFFSSALASKRNQTTSFLHGKAKQSKFFVSEKSVETHHMHTSLAISYLCIFPRLYFSELVAYS